MRDRLLQIYEDLQRITLADLNNFERVNMERAIDELKGIIEEIPK